MTSYQDNGYQLFVEKNRNKLVLSFLSNSGALLLFQDKLKHNDNLFYQNNLGSLLEKGFILGHFLLSKSLEVGINF